MPWFLVSLVPIGLACLIAGSRCRDNYHFWGDVVCGSFLGLVCALVAAGLNLHPLNGMSGNGNGVNNGIRKSYLGLAGNDASPDGTAGGREVLISGPEADELDLDLEYAAFKGVHVQG